MASDDTEYVECVYCGNDITDYDAVVVLERSHRHIGVLVHAECEEMMKNRTLADYM